MTTTSPLVQRAIVTTATEMDSDVDLFGVPVDLPGRAVVLLTAPVRLVVKVESKVDRLEREADALKKLADIDSVPELWFFTKPEFEGDSAVLAMSYVDGDRLAATSPDKAWATAGSELGKLHASDTSSWEQHSSHPDLVNKWAVKLATEARTAELLDETIATEFLQRTIVESATERAPTLIHGELSADHTFYDETSERVSMIDFGDCGFGDPAYDLATLTLWDQDKLELILSGYNHRQNLGDLDTLADDIKRFHLMRLLAGALWLHSYEFTTTPYVSELYERLLD